MSKKKKNVPPGWGTKPLGEILGDVHGAKFTEMWNRHHGNMDVVQRELREYLQPFKAEFEAKGFDVDYLSYAVPYHVSEMVKAEQQEQEAKQAHDSMDLANDIMQQRKPPPSQWN